MTKKFHSRLWEAIQAIEEDSQLEVVVVRSCSDNYRDIALGSGILGALLSFAYVMFAPDFFKDWPVYGTPVAGFAGSYAAANLPLLTRLVVAKTRLRKSVETMARALSLFSSPGFRTGSNDVSSSITLQEALLY